MIDKDKLKRRFSKGAKDYNQHAMVQKIMGDKLMDTVKNNSPKRILEIGSGTGYVTKRLVKLYPNAIIDAIELAPGMIEEAKLNDELNDVNFICGDIEEIDVENKYDLIISNATFQWFNDLKGTIDKLLNALNENGSLVFSTFGTNTFNELNEAFILASKEIGCETILPSQRFIGIQELENIIEREYTVNEDMVIEAFDNSNSFFNSIKKIGANNSSKNRGRATPAFMKKVIEIYNDKFKLDNGVKATYHTIICSVKK